MISHTWLPTRDVVCIHYHKWTRRKIQGLPTGLSSNLMSHCLKFTAVNIPGRQLSLTWPVPIITTGLVHSLARENARSCKVRWSAVLLTGAGAGELQQQPCGMWEKPHNLSARTISIVGMDARLPGDKCRMGIHFSGKPNHSETVTRGVMLWVGTFWMWNACIASVSISRRSAECLRARWLLSSSKHDLTWLDCIIFLPVLE